MIKELMSMNELDAVSGGTFKEYREISKLLPGVPVETADEKHQPYVAERYMRPEEVEDWLNKNLGIWANIDIGTRFNIYLPVNPRGGEKNSYMLNGESVTHSKVIAEIHNYLGK